VAVGGIAPERGASGAWLIALGDSWGYLPTGPGLVLAGGLPVRDAIIAWAPPRKN
jgi:hypothetical protein